MSKLRRLLAVCLGLVLVCGGSPMSATETIFAGVPVYSVMSTVDTDLTLPVGGANAFTPLNIPCPAAAGAKGCTFRVTVSAEFNGASPDAFLQVTTAPFMTVSPSPAIAFAMGGAVQEPVTMQWLIKNVPAGSSPEVQVIGALAGGVAILRQRTQSIDVFYGLL